MKSGRFPEARKALERARLLDRKTPQIVLALAVLSISEYDLDRAERYERELRELGAPSAELSFNLARCWQERGHPERARRHYRMAVETEPSLAQGYFR